MNDATILTLRASVLAAELERLRGIGIPLEHAAALVVKVLEATPAGAGDALPAAASRGRPQYRRHWRVVRAG